MSNIDSNTTQEIKALFRLLDDPDEEIYNSISDRLMNYGTPIIPELEHLWENTIDEATLERIEMMIYKLRFKDLKEAFLEWKDHSEDSLLEGALLITRYHFPELALDNLRHQIEKIRRNIWLELNNYLTPLEQANVLRNILFNYYQLKGTEVNYEHPEQFLLSSPLQSKKGNAFANAILYQILCKQLEINAAFINVPKQCIIAFFNIDHDGEDMNVDPQQAIQFYVEGSSAQAFSQKDLDQYYKRTNIEPKNSHYKPISNQRIIKKLLQEYAKCYQSANLQFKQKDLLSLADLLD
jgi:regulator of sirC expression with transglutaminase-like and TPR domain